MFDKFANKCGNTWLMRGHIPEGCGCEDPSPCVRQRELFTPGEGVLMFQSTQPLCSKCHREPRYPRQRWGKRCFALYHRDRRARLRRKPNKGTTPSMRRPYNTPPPLCEQLKRVVLEVSKYRNRPETIRISLLPCRAHMYVDVRIYLAGKPTRKGITIHSDLLPAVLEGMQRALQTSNQLPRHWEQGPIPAHGQTSVVWPDDTW